MSEAPLDPGLSAADDGTRRCSWCGSDEGYRRYHDEEWGRPSGDDDRLFEKLCLEGFQAGLSWITILRKREAFRELFHGFEIAKVALMGEGDVDQLVSDARIVRHRAKIISAINNAHCAQRIQKEEGSLAKFLWRFEPPPEERPQRVTRDWLMANPATPASTRLSKALRGRGFTFVGPTTMYAFMQSMGFVNDHFEGCVCRAPCEEARAQFRRP